MGLAMRIGQAAIWGGLLLFVSASGAEARPCPNQNVTPITAGEEAAREAMYCLINERRAEAGREKLTRSDSLAKAANQFAAEMVEEQFFSHVTPEGADLTDRARQSGYLRGYQVWALGENIGWGSGVLGSPRQMMDALMKSPGHRRNILSRRYRNLGVGVSTGIPLGGRFGATYVQEFGKRRR